ncbi:MAG: NADH-quinone oxidoreductase subunit NuoH [Chloroflexi bacterium]|nr:MAG: NADH-quinone oxidoreductase subunit NuoH [Chloroflexota bacterium]
MQGIIEYLVSLNLPLLTEGTARFLVLLVVASIVAVVAPASLIILTWLERKIIARIQDRIGPNRAGPFGLLQAVADMIKMFTKEDITPARADRIVYNIAPGLAVFSSVMSFAVIPFAPGFVGTRLNVGLLYIVAVGGLGTLAILMAGWSSNNKYSLLGAFRSVAMLLTYEIPMVMMLVIVAMAAGSMSLADIVDAQRSMWYAVSMPVVFLVFFFAGIAEVGRSPFDLIEAESEIIAGFHTEYSGIKFGMFMIGEYVHMFALSFFSAVLFFGGWHIPFMDVTALPAPWAAIIGLIVLLVKVFFFVFVMMWFRGTLPRFRIDQLLDFGWKFLVPLSLVLLIGVAFVVKLFSPGSSAGIPVPPGPLSGLGIAGEVVGLLVVNLAIAGLAMAVVSALARRSRNKVLRAISAVEPPAAVTAQSKP